MQKLYVLFQTTELSTNGYDTIFSKSNDLKDNERKTYFNKTSKYSSWNGLFIEDDYIRFDISGKQEESGRDGENILIIINKNIKNLKTKQINKIIEKVNYFFSKTFIDLKNIDNKEEYYSICSLELGKLEEALLTEIPELKIDFIEKSKSQISAIINFLSDESNKKFKYLVAILIISIITNIILLIPRNNQPIQVETRKEIASSDKVTTEPTENKNKEIDKSFNSSSIVIEEKNKIIANSINETKSINGNKIEPNTSYKTSSIANEINKQTEPNENDVASLRFPRIKIKANSSKAEKKSIEKPEQKQEEKEEQKPINKFEFIDVIAKNFEIPKDDFIKLVNEKTQWKDFDNLDDNAINQLKDFLDKPDNILFIKLDEDKKEYLKKFFNFSFDKLNKEYVSKCKKALSSFVKAYYELYKNKDIKEKYSELYKSYYPKDRLEFVCHILDIKLESKNNSDETKTYSYIFTENDYKNAKCFEILFLGKKSITEKYLDNFIASEWEIKKVTNKCDNIADFLRIYNSKFKNLINKKLSLENLEKKLIDDYDNWDKDRKEDFHNFSDLEENRYLNFDLRTKKFVHQLISEKVNSNDFEKNLQNLNELYEKFLSSIEKMEEIK